MSNITPEKLAEIKDYCAKATAGPWTEDAESECVVQGDPCSNDARYIPACFDDCLFIVHARTDLPLLVAALEQERQWKEEDPRMLREQIRVSDVAYQHLHGEHKQLRSDLSVAQKRIEELEKQLAREHYNRPIV